MTGFGRGTARVGEAEATVEVRTVNGRFAEVTVRGLGELVAHEAAVQNAVKDAIERGTATVHVTVSAGAAGSGAMGGLVSAIDHVVLTVADTERSGAFYERAFGMRRIEAARQSDFRRTS